MKFDGITTRLVCNELQNLCGARIDKVFQPNKNEIIIGLYKDGLNYALNISIEASNYRLCLTTHSKSNPMIAPNFCMLLRKHLIGLKLKNIYNTDLERLVILEIEGFDEFEDIVSKKLIIELMGKHGNIILLDENSVIIDSLRHIKCEDEIHRNILPHTKYVYPTTDKLNFLDLKDVDEFSEKLLLYNNLAIQDNNTIQDLDINNFADTVCNTFNGFSKQFIENVLKELNVTTIDNSSLSIIFGYINDLIEKNDTHKLILLDNGNGNNLETNYSLNFYIDDFYYNKESNEDLKNYRNTTLKLILEVLKKYKQRLVNMDSKLNECENMEQYRLYGELITANLYKIENRNLDNVTLENYYDNNKPITIKLDNKYLPSINAKRFYKKYNKLKNTLEVVTKQKEETLKEISYLESIVYELETATTTNEIAEIFEEISENVVFEKAFANSTLSKKLSGKNDSRSKVKKSQLTKNKEVSFNPIKYTVDGYIILVGRNNIENDYLTTKYAKKDDLWFHTKDIHGSHVILKLNDKKVKLNSKTNLTTNTTSELDSLNIDESIIYKCAELAVKHSKAKNSSNVPVDYCLVKYVKKPNGAKPGMVIYTTNKTVFVK
ncbi:MAG: NFACT family protein [Clostridia bacterium]|nr:NFACT family protein [Clostridia bacterium]